jgi:bifunctional non-homologous end joining protein LigD
VAPPAARRSAKPSSIPLWHAKAQDVRPMLAALEDAPLCDPELVYEPKYDGIRALVEIIPGIGAAGVTIWSRLGNDKTTQFPELVRALDRFRRKLKIVKRQEFVIGGWTEPRDSRSFFGALLLGVYENDLLRYAGHTGTGFTHAELARVYKLLRKNETTTCPFEPRPRTNERPHWTRPTVVAEIKFTEWTSDNKLRRPTYLGLREDVKPESVHREPTPHTDLAFKVRACAPVTAPAQKLLKTNSTPALAGKRIDDLVSQLEHIEAERGDGVLRLANGRRLQVSNLDKIFWPALRLTKGDLMRYYVRMSSVLLPVVADRPLVMKRFPNGVKGQSFYQQRAPAEVPQGVRVEVVPGDTEVPSRLIGGSLVTLLYMTQLAVISQDPWFSRVQSPDFADYVALDLDPMPGVAFLHVLDVARWLRDELVRFGIPNVPKTSGASGLHIYIPLPSKTTYETGRLFCQMLATIVASKHPKIATVARSVNDRGRTVYIDYLQNIRGKTLATAYSARANDFAGASAPLTWKEVDENPNPKDFTILSLPARVQTQGDLWAPLRTSPGADLRGLLERFAS